MAAESERLEWRDGTPVSRRFDDPYYSLGDGLAEARHVFLAGNGLPERFRPGFHIAELGFGTGLNAAAAWAAWRRAGIEGALRFTSFEAFPLTAAEIAAALEAFPEIAPEAEALAGADLTRGEVALDGLVLTVVPGDARESLAGWRGAADAWFLDGFAPARNPELWEPALLAEVARHTRAGGTFATYTAAGDVRRGLAAAGFKVERLPGYGRKRHMTVGRL